MKNEKIMGFMVGFCIGCLLISEYSLTRIKDFNRIKKANEKLQEKVMGLEQSLEMYKTFCGEKK